MAHASNLILAFGILLGIAAGFAAGRWARGRHRKTVI
jgi:hypothetical protein